MKNQNQEYLETLKAEDIYNTFIEMRKELLVIYPHITNQAIFDMLVMKEAPRFYICTERAQRIISIMEKGADPNLICKSRVQMFKELFKRYKSRRKKDPYIPKYILIEQIINEPAPSFYSCYFSIKRTVYDYIRNEK